LVDDGGVNSVSAAVDVERLLEDDGNPGAEKVLDAIECNDSCDSGRYCLCSGAIEFV